jgi:genome maintenance exonuclease 1
LESTRKQFEHELFPSIDLEAVMVEGKRYYKTPSGKYYPSVTTILSSGKNDAIDKWRKRVGEKEANRISRQATSRGTGMHTICENYINNEVFYTKGRMPSEIQLFKGIRHILDEHVTKVYGLEMAVFSDTLKTAGRLDLFCQFQGMYTILDFKTSSKDKKEDWIENYFIQATCYAIMIEEMCSEFRPGMYIPQLAIVIAVDDGEKPYQLFVKKTADYREKAKQFFAEYHENNPVDQLQILEKLGQ